MAAVGQLAAMDPPVWRAGGNDRSCVAIHAVVVLVAVVGAGEGCGAGWLALRWR